MPVRVGEMQIGETEGETRLHIQHTASELRVGEMQLLMQPMRGPLLSIKSHLSEDFREWKYTIAREGNNRENRGVWHKLINR